MIQIPDIQNLEACETGLFCVHPAVVAEWVYERLQIQVAESHR